MASRIEGLDEKIIACAQAEFLERGFTDASLRTIAFNAGTSTSAIYTRYGDKDGLFSELVGGTVREFKELLKTLLEDFSVLPEEEQTGQHVEYADRKFPRIVSYIYANYIQFKLLITCSAGTIYKDLLEELAELDTACTIRFLRVMGIDVENSRAVTADFLHVLSSAFYAGIFEVVIHDMPKDEAVWHVTRLRRFYAAGWSDILNSR